MDGYDTGSMGQLVSTTYALVVAQQQLTQEHRNLVAALNKASGDSGRMALLIGLLTGCLVIVGLLQVAAASWPWLTWWWQGWPSIRAGPGVQARRHRNSMTERLSSLAEAPGRLWFR